jgi:DNA-binding CsgD family transcriptional regulator
MHVARLTGIEAESRLSHAALHRLLVPFLGRTERLPIPQRQALGSTFGLVDGYPADQFLLALGVLALLTDVASEVPVLGVVDDAQWLDDESAMVLGFVARRLHVERILLLFATREPADQLSSLSGLPELPIGALGDREAVELLSSLTPGKLSPHVCAYLVAETGGNPLALAELARELSPGQLAGYEALPDPLPVGRSFQELFRRQLNGLSPHSRLLLSLAAAEPTAPEALLWRAAEQLDIDPGQAVAGVSDLVELSPEVCFHNPLLRLAAYHLTPIAQRGPIHRALAAANDAYDRPDRVVWHLAVAASGPDDRVAAREEHTGGHARERAGHGAVASVTALPAKLSLDEGQDTNRLLAAADAAITSGQPYRASALLDQALVGPIEELQAATALRLSGEVSFATGQFVDAASGLLAAARSLAPLDAALARLTLLRALEAANHASGPSIERVRTAAAEILPDPSRVSPPASVVEGLLAGLLHRLAGEHRQAVPLLRGAVAELQDKATPEDLLLPCLLAGTFAASELLDDTAQSAVAAEYVRVCRQRSTLTELPLALAAMSNAYLREGRLSLAEDACAEIGQIAAATGKPGLPSRDRRTELGVLAWRGREAEVRAVAAEVTAEMAKRGLGAGVNDVRSQLTVLDLGLGNYREALAHAEYVLRNDPLGAGTLILPDVVEAATRCAQLDIAHEALERLSVRARAAGAPWGLGLLARSRALLANDVDAEPLYREAIDLLRSTQAPLDLARAHLVYGEWLRRQGRRVDARAQLRTACDMLADMGAGAFAKRARTELEATCEHARKRSADTADALTPQEAEIASLVSEGFRNRDIASRLFVSPATVDYHLRKVFRKVGVASRTQLARAMMINGAATPALLRQQ